MRKTRPVILFIAIITAVFFFVSAQQAFADDVLLFDRGLPTTNVNSGTANQSNVSWADSEPTANPTQYWLPGDDFTLTNNSKVTDIRVWIVASGTEPSGYLPTGLSLLGGYAGGSIGTISNYYTSKVTTYPGGQSYQGQGGGIWNIYQVDFAVSLNIKGGQLYDFFVNQPYVCSGDPCTAYNNAFLSASNAGLSGSTQTGADGTFLWLDVNGNSQQVETWNSAGSGWDKNSDANVQVFGTPEPGSIVLLGSGLLGLVGVVRRKFGKCA